MDSFYLSVAPCPMQKPILEPSVPEASLLFNNNSVNTYQGWKNNIKTNTQWNDTNAIVKKQVRFNSPTMSKNSTNTVLSDLNKSNNNNNESNVRCTPPMNKVFKNRQFEEIYMANIPNRHLDLSLMDIAKPVTKPHNSVENSIIDIVQESSQPQKTPTTYKEFLEMQKRESGNGIKSPQNDVACVTDIFNYSSPRNRSAGKTCELINFSRKSGNCETKNQVLKTVSSQDGSNSKSDTSQKINIGCQDLSPNEKLQRYVHNKKSTSPLQNFCDEYLPNNHDKFKPTPPITNLKDIHNKDYEINRRYLLEADEKII
ncbi:hypothetical protein HHI36_016218 [Cryptolaemus montrouzieri]|uniref:Exophilin 5 n=1 Tax=Cryptolaemus montrouzieri TaxID=559131 RepID=A0ABD2NJY5_9CUCU